MAFLSNEELVYCTKTIEIQTRKLSSKTMRLLIDYNNGLYLQPLQKLLDEGLGIPEICEYLLNNPSLEFLSTADIQMLDSLNEEYKNELLENIKFFKALCEFAKCNDGIDDINPHKPKISNLQRRELEKIFKKLMKIPVFRWRIHGKRQTRNTV